MSDAEKQRSHNRILASAAQLFRARGIESTSVADVMKAAGMTHAGFYRHFASKAELIAAAFDNAVDDVVSDMEQETTGDGKRRKRQDYVAAYLSLAHVEDSGQGCPLAALGSELGRIGGGPRQAGARASTRMAELLQEASETGSGQGVAAMALLMGTVTLARLADTSEEADRVLEAGRIGVDLLKDHWPKEER